MDADLDALATRLYVTIDDVLKDHPGWRPERPRIGIAPKLSDSELTLAVIQVLARLHVRTALDPLRETVRRSDMAGDASYGYCSSHSRWFWGLRLHLVTTPAGLGVPYALTSATTNERDTALAMFHLDADLINRPGQTLKADKGYRSAAFEAELNAAGITLIRPALKSETTRPGPTLIPGLPTHWQNLTRLLVWVRSLWCCRGAAGLSRGRSFRWR